jgi:hypothetical protein
MSDELLARDFVRLVDRAMPDAEVLTEAVFRAAVSPETQMLVDWLRDLTERVERLEGAAK